MKEKIYEIIANSGIWFLYKFFPEYFAKDPLRPTDRYIEYPFALDYINILKPKRILDVGCSGSMFPLLIKSICGEVNAIDIRPCNYDGITFDKESITKTHFYSNTFDVITAISTIEHIGLKGRYKAGEDDRDIKALWEIYRILRPNGVLIMTVPYGDKYKVTKFHKIYDKKYIDYLLASFKYTLEIKPSPEADYKLALIRAVK